MRVALGRRAVGSAVAVAAAVGLAFFGSQLEAGTFTAFGPETFVRPAGAPAAAIRTFSVRSSTVSYTLRVRNGIDGREPVPAAVISLSGAEILGPSALNQSVSLIGRPVVLSSGNELLVELRSKPASAVSGEVVGVDEDAPSIEAAASLCPTRPAGTTVR